MTHFNVVNRVPLGINIIGDPNSISVYPNPANSEITINAAGQKIEKAIIYNTAGQSVLATGSPAQNTMDVSGLADGIYFVEIKVKETTTRVKFVKVN